jgi:predicted metal-dependent enzyme (double-stranded beta helix superfamily)
MTITRTPQGTPGVNRFTPAQLLRTARLFASDPQLPDLLGPDSGERLFVELDSSPYLQIWLLSWPAGTNAGWHDHDESAGAFLVVRGALRERTAHGGQRTDRTLIAGEGRSFGPNHVHNVANVGVDTALSVHVYTPRLTALNHYAETPAGLQLKAVDKIGVNW